LRITLEENTEATTLRLEGRVAGPWAAELSRVWEQTLPRVSARPFYLDLRETTYADAGGIQVLRAIFSQTGATILTGTPWTQYLAQRVKRENAEAIGEEV
jgi:anti-anti-sigma regulatory factor